MKLFIQLLLIILASSCKLRTDNASIKQGSNVKSCKCEESVQKSKNYKLSEDKYIILCTYEEITDNKQRISEFVVLDCQNKTKVLEYYPMSYYSFNYVDTSLEVTMYKELPGKTGEYQIVPFLLYNINARNGTIMLKKRLLYDYPKINEGRKKIIYNIFDGQEYKKLSYKEIENITYELFYLTLSGENRANNILNNYNDLFKDKLDGSLSETYKEIKELQNLLH